LQLILGQPGGVTIATYVDQLVEAGLIADKFAFAVQRSVSKGANAASIDTGVFVLGGGEECTDLYSGEFSSVRVADEAFYNTNLVRVEIGERNIFSIAVVPPPRGSGAASNSFLDSGNSG
jgi:hypothetical protein